MRDLHMAHRGEGRHGAGDAAGLGAGPRLLDGDTGTAGMGAPIVSIAGILQGGAAATTSSERA